MSYQNLCHCFAKRFMKKKINPLKVYVYLKSLRILGLAPYFGIYSDNVLYIEHTLKEGENKYGLYPIESCTLKFWGSFLPSPWRERKREGKGTPFAMFTGLDLEGRFWLFSKNDPENIHFFLSLRKWSETVANFFYRTALVLNNIRHKKCLLLAQY